ncbi:hypothetical protein RHSIM_Rhsim11G0015900 [Rhododendron simsii]|uniref:Uncharacterized protein n=1 Tax=Rhododendron simsii TaxID=118357 RepID=A0A834G7L4_RHOSS|nr:hypothetical protein RHSIM_Rhsim11G0015900 [Rhododendron simsii]
MANGKRNFIKPCSLATMKKTKYEMARDERMKENNARLKAAGIDRILADLRGSSLPNCTNEKRRGTRNGVDDPDYTPPSIEDANDDESLDSLEHELQQIPPSGPTRSEVDLQHDSTRVLERVTRSTPHPVVESQPSPPRNVEIQSEVAAVSSADDLSVKSWKAVDEGIKAPLLQSLKDQFDFEGDPIDVNKAITSRCGRRLSDYTHRLYEKFKKLKATKGEAYARSHPPPQIAMEQWTRLIEKKWTNKDWLVTKTFTILYCTCLNVWALMMLRSEKNIENRRSNKTKHRCGTKSLAVRVHEHVRSKKMRVNCLNCRSSINPLTIMMTRASGLLQNARLTMYVYQVIFVDRKSVFQFTYVVSIHKKWQEEMVQVDATVNQEGATPLTGEQVSVTVLKKRPGYVKGLGLRPSSSIRTTSESALKALGLRPSSFATNHEYVSCLEMKIEAQNETIEKLLEANRQQQKINASMMEFLIEKGYTGHVGSAETLSND